MQEPYMFAPSASRKIMENLQVIFRGFLVMNVRNGSIKDAFQLKARV